MEEGGQWKREEEGGREEGGREEGLRDDEMEGEVSIRIRGSKSTTSTI